MYFFFNSNKMWSKHLSLMQVFLATLISILWIVQSSSYVAAEFCAEDLTEEEISFTCSCNFRNEVCKKIAHKDA